MKLRIRRGISATRGVRKTSPLLKTVGPSTRNMLSFANELVVTTPSVADEASFASKSAAGTTVNTEKPGRLEKEASFSFKDEEAHPSCNRGRRQSFLTRLGDSTKLMLSFEEVNIPEEQLVEPEFPQPVMRRNVTLDRSVLRDCGPVVTTQPKRTPRTFQRRRRQFVSTEEPKRGVSRTKSTPDDLPSRRNFGVYHRPSIEIGPGFTFAVQKEASFVSRLGDSIRSIDEDFEHVSQPLRATDEEIPLSALRRSVSLDCADAMESNVRALNSGGTRRPDLHRTISTPQDLPSRRNSGGWERHTIDIVPGYSVPLHGTQETLAAFKQDRVFQTECSNCETFLYCISTASMLLCPVCREMSPILTNDDPTSTIETTEESLGMGLTVDFVISEHN